SLETVFPRDTGHLSSLHEYGEEVGRERQVPDLRRVLAQVLEGVRREGPRVRLLERSELDRGGPGAEERLLLGVLRLERDEALLLLLERDLGRELVLLDLPLLLDGGGAASVDRLVGPPLQGLALLRLERLRHLGRRPHRDEVDRVAGEPRLLQLQVVHDGDE